MFKSLKEALSDGETVSFGRLAAGVSLCFVLFWATRVNIKTNAMPDLFGGTIFIASCFALSKGMDVAQAVGMMKKQ